MVESCPFLEMPCSNEDVTSRQARRNKSYQVAPNQIPQTVIQSYVYTHANMSYNLGGCSTDVNCFNPYASPIRSHFIYQSSTDAQEPKPSQFQRAPLSQAEKHSRSHKRPLRHSRWRRGKWRPCRTVTWGVRQGHP